MWSATGFDTAVACDARYFWEVIIPEPGPEPPLGVWGISHHYMFQRFLTSHRSTGRYPFEQLKDFLGAWRGLWWGAVGDMRTMPDGRILASNPRNPFNSLEKFDSWINRQRKPPNQPVEVAWEYLAQPGVLFEQGNEILTKFHERHVRRRGDGTINLLEVRFNGLDWHGLKLNGVIDRIAIQPSGAWIVDYKDRWLDYPVLASGTQLTFYQLAYHYLRARGKIPGQPPLRGMFIYNYRRNAFQAAPLRTPREIGHLYLKLRQKQAYFDGVLFGRRPPTDLASTLPSEKLRDIETGDITPLFPRGNHCRYCRAFRQCREWELGQRPTARQAFAERHRLEKVKLVPSQLVIPVTQEPQVVARAAEYEQLVRLVLPVQISLEELIAPRVSLPRIRVRKRRVS
ncbi:MAG: PD-(D/E)XK nuclease family protein [Candidatus Kerfeldbacteria bacterium]|nr:PD-(D/E)XK nuclease family protein [Candidatus Kerfeldbacteria bacterium]